MVTPEQELFIAYKSVGQTYAISIEYPATPANRSYFSTDGTNYSSIGDNYNINLRAKLRNSVSTDDIVFQPADKSELQTAVNLWVSDNATALSTYGEINTWDVSLITDISELFRNKSTFNDDISNWDVSNVTSMNNTFRSATSFEQDLADWNVSNVTTMRTRFK